MVKDKVKGNISCRTQYNLVLSEPRSPTLDTKTHLKEQDSYLNWHFMRMIEAFKKATIRQEEAPREERSKSHETTEENTN